MLPHWPSHTTDMKDPKDLFFPSYCMRDGVSSQAQAGAECSKRLDHFLGCRPIAGHPSRPHSPGVARIDLAANQSPPELRGNTWRTPLPVPERLRVHPARGPSSQSSLYPIKLTADYLMLDATTANCMLTDSVLPRSLGELWYWTIGTWGKITLVSWLR